MVMLENISCSSFLTVRGDDNSKRGNKRAFLGGIGQLLGGDGVSSRRCHW